MILFINIFLTNHRLYGYERYNLPGFDRYDIFRYTLASYAAINRWSKCIFYIQLDQDFIPKQQDLEQYIHSIFGKENCSIYWHRNVYTVDWRKAYEEVASLPDELIWSTCNDDHVFMDYDLSMIDEAIKYMTEDREKLTTCYWSHYPEIIRVAALECQEKKGNFITFHWNVHDAIQILNKEVFRSYWFDYDFGDKSIARLDVIHDYTDPKMVVKCYAPTRELCRHFDGYSHVGNLSSSAPPLTIPPGFFENDIKILYCSNERREGWVNVNPLASDYFAVNKFGTDYKWIVPDDIPLFWRDKISTIEVDRKIPKDRLIQARNDAIIAKTKAVGNCFCRSSLPFPPNDWLTPHLR
jgi:hypothetical protein